VSTGNNKKKLCFREEKDLIMTKICANQQQLLMLLLLFELAISIEETINSTRRRARIYND